MFSAYFHSKSDVFGNVEGPIEDKKIFFKCSCDTYVVLALQALFFL